MLQAVLVSGLITPRKRHHKLPGVLRDTRGIFKINLNRINFERINLVRIVFLRIDFLFGNTYELFS